MFYQFFFSQQVKQSLIIRNKVVYKSYIMGCWMTRCKNGVKTSWNLNLAPSLLSKKKISSILAKISLKIEIKLFPKYSISHEN